MCMCAWLCRKLAAFRGTRAFTESRRSSKGCVVKGRVVKGRVALPKSTRHAAGDGGGDSGDSGGDDDDSATSESGSGTDDDECKDDDGDRERRGAIRAIFGGRAAPRGKKEPEVFSGTPRVKVRMFAVCV